MPTDSVDPGSPSGGTDTSPALKLPATSPARIGHYHIKRLLAAGGMGLVYEAMQENPHRAVALKVMKHGVTSRTAQRRFEYESQVLSRLRHPGIAQVYEAGIHDDAAGPLPYFAMEYIPNARPITKYAAENRLYTEQRLELFIRVCEAVHHGHQKGVIHRDLKPANILVDSGGQVKIIDFGVARSTDSDLAATTQQTFVGEMIGTLKYMSPEQCEADPHDIDTRSDVYALGVVLYELLSGRMPYDLEHTPVFELPRVIREVAATRLGSVNRTLRGDVEVIVDKALAKDRTRRYQSAQALAEDIGRVLKNEPILARPPSMLYQLGKFVQRRKGLVVTATIVTLSLAVGFRFKLEAQQAAMVVARADEARKLAQSARTLAARGKHEEATRDSTEALALDPANSLALRTRGYLLLERGRFAEALEAYNAGLRPIEEVLSTIPEDLHNRARVRRLSGGLKQALADHDLSVSLFPNKALVYVSRGLTRRIAGNVDEAMEDLHRGAAMDASWAVQCNLWIWETRMLRGAAGDQEAALGALEAAAAAASASFDHHYVALQR